MKSAKRMIWFIGLTALIAWVGTASGAMAQDGFFVEGPDAQQRNHTVLTCRGRIGLVIDAADESVHGTPAIFGTAPGGGEGLQFDPTPILTVPGVSLQNGECVNAHLSVIVGSAQTYGVAPLALFQVTLRPAGGAPIHMVGHYETPYGFTSPAVALEAETDVDMLAANFFQRVGTGPHEIPPGVYTAEVWWAGAPPFTPGGSIGAAVVLKLYLRD